MSPYDNHLYISDPERHQILRIHTTDRVEDPESNYDVFVGSGLRCLPSRDPSSCGDGGSALEAKLSFPKGLAFTFDGSLYFADGTMIRVVNRRGVIQTVIGGPNSLLSSSSSPSSTSKNPNNNRSQWKPIPCGEAVPASEVTLRWPTELSIHPIDGSLYFIDDQMLLRLTPDHRVLVVAGLPSYCKSEGTSSSSSSDRGGSGKGGISYPSSRKNKDKNFSHGVPNSPDGLEESDDQEEEELMLMQRDPASSSKTSIKKEKKSSSSSASAVSSSSSFSNSGSLSTSSSRPSDRKKRVNVDVGSVISFAFSPSNGDLFIGSVDGEGVHRVFLLRESRGRQEVVHFFGSPV